MKKLYSSIRKSEVFWKSFSNKKICGIENHIFFQISIMNLSMYIYKWILNNIFWFFVWVSMFNSKENQQMRYIDMNESNIDPHIFFDKHYIFEIEKKQKQIRRNFVFVSAWKQYLFSPYFLFFSISRTLLFSKELVLLLLNSFIYISTNRIIHMDIVSMIQ